MKVVFGGKYKTQRQRMKAIRRFKKRCLGRHDIYALIANHPNMTLPRNCAKN